MHQRRGLGGGVTLLRGGDSRACHLRCGQWGVRREAEAASVPVSRAPLQLNLLQLLRGSVADIEMHAAYVALMFYRRRRACLYRELCCSCCENLFQLLRESVAAVARICCSCCENLLQLLRESVAAVARLCCRYRDACCLCSADVLPAKRCEVLGFRV